jgi:hypothetical protein
MKQLFAGLIYIVLILGLANPAHSQEGHKHGVHGVDFFKLNGQPAVAYPFTKQTASLSFTLPDYRGPREFIVNQNIDIEIDPRVLETAYIKSHNSTIPDARFIWKFGDGRQSLGTRNKHRYTRAGSYLLGVYIESRLFETPLLFKTLLIHVLPHKNYRLPKAVITIGNQSGSERSHDALKISFTGPIQLDGTRSIRGSSRIADYFWDLSDRASSRDPILKHTYNRSSYNATPILRVKDSRGFISDASVEIINQDTSSERRNH